MANLVDILRQRGFIEQTTHAQELADYFDAGPATGYIGFDPTASSLHIGSLVPIMSLAHMQRAGHRPIALVGGGTGMVGDPSGKTEMRKMLTVAEIEQNAAGIKRQLSRFLDFSDGRALLLDTDNGAEQLFSSRFACPVCSYSLAELEPLSIETKSMLFHPEDLEHSRELLQRHLQQHGRMPTGGDGLF